MNETRPWLLLPVTLLMLHCGVRSDLGDAEGSGAASGSHRPDPNDDDSSPRTDSGSGNDDRKETAEPGTGSPTDPQVGDSGRPLEACERGTRPEEGSCDWLADGLCYQTKDQACDCICPRDRESVCLSGFWGGADSETPVHCQ